MKATSGPRAANHALVERARAPAPPRASLHVRLMLLRAVALLTFVWMLSPSLSRGWCAMVRPPE